MNDKQYLYKLLDTGRTPVEEINPPPPMWPPFMMPFPILVFAGLATYSGANGNWSGAAIDAAITAIFVGLLLYRQIKVRNLHRQYRSLKAMKTILETPILREDGYSVVFTFIAPSDELMAFMRANFPAVSEHKE